MPDKQPVKNRPVNWDFQRKPGMNVGSAVRIKERIIIYKSHKTQEHTAEEYQDDVLH